MSSEIFIYWLHVIVYSENMVFEKDLKDYLKTAFMALLPGVFFALLLGGVFGAINQVGTLGTAISWILWAIVLIWVVPNLPKEMDTFWEVLIISLMLMGIVSAITAFVPSIGTYMNFVSISSPAAWIAMIIVSGLSLAVLHKYTDWL